MGLWSTLSGTCVGLDIGSSAIKAIELGVGRGGTRLVSFGIEPLPPQAIVDGAIMDQGAVVEAIGRLKTALSWRTRHVATAISGHSVIVKKIVLPRMSPADLEQQIPIEAERHIPFKRDEVDIDHQVVAAENGKGQMEVILVAAKKEMIADYTQVIRDARLTPAVMEVAAFSVQNAFESSYGAAEGAAPVALIHVGHAITHINIVAGGGTMFTRDVTVGGAAFTEELQRRLHVGHDEAEAFKTGTSADAGTGPEVQAIVDEVADSTAAKLQRSLDLFLNGAHDVSLGRIYLSGGTAKVPALARRLEDRAHVPVEVLDPFRATAVDPAKLDPEFVRAHAAEAAVAAGLARRRPGESAS
jgi:type IV pilus assembly protein PilM